MNVNPYQAPSPLPQPEQEISPSKSDSTAYRRALGFALVQQLVLSFLTSVLLDAERFQQAFIMISCVFWISAVIVNYRRIVAKILGLQDDSWLNQFGLIFLKWGLLLLFILGLMTY